MRVPLLVAAAAAALSAQTASFEGHEAFTLANDKLEFTILKEGTGISRVVLKDDPAHLSPLWDPARMARESGQKPAFNSGTGHFLCVDGFGGVSPEERSAGLPSHGEAHLQTFTAKTEPGAIVLTARLPIVQEDVTRTLRLAEGEQVLLVETRLESLLGFDRPILWAEHATIGSPFLQPGVTVVDMSAHQAQTRPYKQPQGGLPHRFTSGQDFTWPMAPGVDGKPVNLRLTPESPNSGDHAACLMDKTRALEWVAAINPELKLMLGYLFRRDDFPWVQTWENYPPSKKLARGMEFSTQPYDVPRREVVSLNSLFDTPLYRWLPAKSAITSRFLMFYTRVPSGFLQVDEVRLENGSLVVEDKKSGLSVRLKCSQTL